MRIFSIVSTILLMHFATGVWSAVAIQCNPNLEVSWSFDQIENKSNFFEIYFLILQIWEDKYPGPTLTC